MRLKTTNNGIDVEALNSFVDQVRREPSAGMAGFGFTKWEGATRTGNNASGVLLLKCSSRVNRSACSEFSWSAREFSDTETAFVCGTRQRSGHRRQSRGAFGQPLLQKVTSRRRSGAPAADIE